MDRKGVSEILCVRGAELLLFKCQLVIKYVHGRDQYLMGQGCTSERKVPFSGVRKRIFHSLLTSVFLRYFSQKY